MRLWPAAACLALLLSSCGSAGDPCNEKSGSVLCGYCNEDVVLSSNPNAGKCLYCGSGSTCTGPVCGAMSCVGPGGVPGGTSGTCSQAGAVEYFTNKCHTTAGGIQFEGAAWAKKCGTCPSGITSTAGTDNVSPNGPYWICMCT